MEEGEGILDKMKLGAFLLADFLFNYNIGCSCQGSRSIPGQGQGGLKEGGPCLGWSLWRVNFIPTIWLEDEL